jgi:hypothetical protein
VQTGSFEMLKEQMNEEYLDLIKIIELKQDGVKVVNQDYLYQYEGEKIDAFISRISTLN